MTAWGYKLEINTYTTTVNRGASMFLRNLPKAPTKILFYFENI
jgi:hypothetical protein